MHAFYPTPADGSPESADPHFVARVRKCGCGCGNEFTTTAQWRYACENCRGRLKKLSADRQPHRVNLAKPAVRRTRDWTDIST